MKHGGKIEILAGALNNIAAALDDNNGMKRGGVSNSVEKVGNSVSQSIWALASNVGHISKALSRIADAINKLAQETIEANK